MTTAANQDLSAQTFALQLRPGVAKNLAAVIPKVLDFLQKALTAGQSFNLSTIILSPRRNGAIA